MQWLDDRKWAYVRLEGRAFGDVPINMEYKLEVWDSPNSAGIIIDAIRCGEDRQGPWDRRRPALGLVVPDEVPAVQRPDDEGAASVERFISGEEPR